MIFLVYAKKSFKPELETIHTERKILEKLLFVNHPINIKTSITNHGAFKKILITDSLPENSRLISGDNMAMHLLRPEEEVTLEYQIEVTSRGNHSINDIEFTLADPWHFFTQQTKKPCTSTLIVHSDPEEIKKAKRISTREHVELVMPSLIGTETMDEMEGIRDYLPGDSLKDIEWKATSRLQTLMTKFYQKKEVIETIIMLDCSRSMRRTTGGKSKIDQATNVAIHLTKILQSIRHPVGLIAFDEFKTLRSIEPVNTYNQIFEALTDLPGHIQTTGYTPQQTIEPASIPNDKSKSNQQFLSTIFPFLAQGKRRIYHPAQASGIYEALRPLLLHQRTRHLIIITDMETNLKALYNSLQLAHAKKYKIWLLTSFSPYYHLDKHHLTKDELAHIYKLHAAREKALLNLRKMNIDIVELTPSTEGGRIIEKIRRKNP